jgi:hypothetical protein
MLFSTLQFGRLHRPRHRWILQCPGIYQAYGYNCGTAERCYCSGHPGINLSEVVNKWTVVALKDALSEGAPATNGVSRIVAVVERAITWDLSFGTGRRCRMPLEAQFALHHVLWRYGRWIRCRTSPSIAVDLVNKDPEIVRLSGNLGKEVPSAIELGTIRMTYSTVG